MKGESQSAEHEGRSAKDETQSAARHRGAESDQTETVADLAQLYLGNILYAIELAALSLEDQQKPADAAFYRGIARKLAEARGREREAQA